MICECGKDYADPDDQHRASCAIWSEPWPRPSYDQLRADLARAEQERDAAQAGWEEAVRVLNGTEPTVLHQLAAALEERDRLWWSAWLTFWAWVGDWVRYRAVVRTWTPPQPTWAEIQKLLYDSALADTDTPSAPTDQHPDRKETT